MDAKWVIYRKILGQNSRWKMILPLKKSFGSLNQNLSEIWLLNCDFTVEISSQLLEQTQIQYGALDGWPLEASMSSMIWVVRSMQVWSRLSNHAREIGDLLPKNHRYFDDFPLSQPTYWKNRWFIAFCRNISIFTDFSPLQ